MTSWRPGLRNKSAEYFLLKVVLNCCTTLTKSVRDNLYYYCCCKLNNTRKTDGNGTAWAPRTRQRRFTWIVRAPVVVTTDLSATTVKPSDGVTTSRALAAPSIPQARATKAVRAILLKIFLAIDRSMDMKRCAMTTIYRSTSRSLFWRLANRRRSCVWQE